MMMIIIIIVVSSGRNHSQYSLHIPRRDFKTLSLPVIRQERIRGVTVSRNRAIQINIYLLTYLPTKGWPGWVGLSGLENTAVVYPPVVVANPSTNRARRSLTFVGVTNAA